MERAGFIHHENSETIFDQNETQKHEHIVCESPQPPKKFDEEIHDMLKLYKSTCWCFFFSHPKN